jgi:Nif-specific regulatory protein
VVAATAKDLAREAGDGHFRWDLFYRVSTIVIPVPPLRRRRSDIPMLVEHFLGANARRGKALRFTPDAMERLLEYGWPGNIRELRNLVERLHILHEGSEVRADDLPAEFGRAATTAAAAAARPAAAEPASVLVPLADVERRHVERVLQATSWNKARAARVLEVDIKTLNKKIRDFKLAPAD